MEWNVENLPTPGQSWFLVVVSPTFDCVLVCLNLILIDLIEFEVDFIALSAFISVAKFTQVGRTSEVFMLPDWHSNTPPHPASVAGRADLDLVGLARPAVSSLRHWGVWSGYHCTAQH